MSGYIYKTKYVLKFFVGAPVLLFMVYFTPWSVRYLEGLIPMSTCLISGEMLIQDNNIDSSLKVGFMANPNFHDLQI